VNAPSTASSAGQQQLAGALALIREIPDFPEPGVLFRDLGPVFADGPAFHALIDGLVATLDPATDVLVAVEARGFLLGAAVAQAAGLGVVPVRKPGKTPLVAHRVEYALEYGTNALELPEGLLAKGQRAVIIDDVLATGGTVAASVELVEYVGAEVLSVSVVMELAALGGRRLLANREITALLTM
jgi:adenine phosphoribosyltransferase